MVHGGLFQGVMSLRQVLVQRPQGCCVGVLEDLQQIHLTIRQFFPGVLSQRSLDPGTLERLGWSVERQIEAGQDLQLQLVGCGAGEDIQDELTDLIEYLRAVHQTITMRLDTVPSATKRTPS